MKWELKMEIALIIITSVLCTVLLLKILNRLRSVIPWRVNCWFCNSNCWVKYPEHNSWTCPKCDQYNGFTKDGDYNKTLCSSNDQVTSPKAFLKSSPKNGLCKMCNINQQLKVTQLANFVPMSNGNFDEEIEAYRMQLEKAYKLCTSCRKVLQMKLNKEKEVLLGTKLLESRSPEKKHQKYETRKRALNNLINNISMLIAALLFILISYELYKNLKNYENLPKTITNIVDIMKGLTDRVGSILKMKMFTTFPFTEAYFINITTKQYFDMLPKSFYSSLTFDHLNMTTQKMLGVIVCVIQIIANIWNINSLRYTVVIDLLWTIFVLSLAEIVVVMNPLLTSVIKIMNVFILLTIYNMIRKPGRNPYKTQFSPKPKMKLNNSSMNKLIENEDTMNVDSDDDVSLSKFGLHDCSESSNETINPLNTSLMSGRNFSPRNNSLWTKPKHNSTFCVNTAMCKSPSIASETVFAKPSFNSYQKHTKNDSDSDLDESISCLSLGGPTKSMNKTNSIFSLRKFTASPCFVTPTPINRGRPLISPSKLGHSTSWVAGGYWGGDSDRQNIFNVDGSRSSSQSSGFESQTSSMNQRNMFSHPPSREESVCGEPMVLDQFIPSMSNLSSYQPPQSFNRMSSPVFPQMQYNGHVHIPQARFPHPSSHNLFVQQTQFVQNRMFKAPSGSGLIKLPQTSSFTSH